MERLKFKRYSQGAKDKNKIVVRRSPDLAQQTTEGLQYTSMERYRIYEDGHLYFVTFTVIEWLPVFINESACLIVTNSLNFCHMNKRLGINAYVIMPTHFHAILFDLDFNSQRLNQTIFDFRKFTGRQLSDYCAEHLPSCFNQVQRLESGQDRERRFWQSTKHPEQIYSEAFWKQKLDYIHDNPRRSGLVHQPEDWRFSSAAYWLYDQAQNDVILSAVEW